MAFIELVPAERAGDAADLFEADTTLRGAVALVLRTLLP